MNFSLAIFVCLAAYAVAAPSISSSVQQLIVQQAIDKLQAQLSASTNPALQALLQQAIDKLKQQFAIQRLVDEVDMQRGFWDSMSSVFGLDKVWGVIQAFHGQAKEQLMALLTQAIFQGGNMITKFKEVLKNMAAQLLEHGTNAGPIITDTLAQLQNLLTGAIAGAISRSNERGIFDTLANVFGLSDIIGAITNLHSAASAKFLELLQKIIFSGKQVWALALPVIQQFHTNVLGHLNQLPEYLNAAIAELSSILSNHISGGNSRMLDEQRGFWDVVSNTLGLGTIWSTITAMHGAMKDKFMNLLAQVMLGGTNMWAAAKPILGQMVASLTDHASNGKPILEDTVAQLQALLLQHAGNIIG